MASVELQDAHELPRRLGRALPPQRRQVRFVDRGPGGAPVLDRACPVEAAGFAFQDLEVVERIELLAVPAVEAWVAGAEEGGGLRDAGNLHHRRAPVALRLGPRRVGQRQEAIRAWGMGAFPVVDGLAHDPLAAGKAVVGDQPVVDALGGVARLAGRGLVRRQPGVDDRRDRFQDRPRLGFGQAIPARLGLVAGEDLADDPPPVVQLAGDRPHALVVDEGGPANGLRQLHRRHPVPRSPGRHVPGVAG